MAEATLCRRCFDDIDERASRRLCSACFEDLIGYDDCQHCGSPVVHESTVTEEVIRCMGCPARMISKGSKEDLRIKWNRSVYKGHVEVTEDHPNGCYCFACFGKRRETHIDVKCSGCDGIIEHDDPITFDCEGAVFCPGCAESLPHYQ